MNISCKCFIYLIVYLCTCECIFSELMDIKSERRGSVPSLNKGIDLYMMVDERPFSIYSSESNACFLITKNDLVIYSRETNNQGYNVMCDDTHSSLNSNYNEDGALLNRRMCHYLPDGTVAYIYSDNDGDGKYEYFVDVAKKKKHIIKYVEEDCVESEPALKK